MDAAAAIDAAPATAIGSVLTAAKRTRGTLAWSGLTAAQSAALPATAGLDRDTYALARCVSSECYASGAKYSPTVMLSVAECIIAEARASKRTIWSLLVERTSADYAWTQGAFGEQHGRYASTARTPNGRGLAAARAALAGTSIARGARAWMAPNVNDGGTQGGRTVRDAISVATGWAQSGREWVGPLPGVQSYHHACFRQLPSGSKATVDAFAAMVRDGRAGRSTLGPSLVTGTSSAAPASADDPHPTLTGAAGAAAVAVGVAVVTRSIP